MSTLYDRSVRMYEEGYPPEILEKMLEEGGIHKGSFLNEKFHNSHYLQMKTIYDLASVGGNSVLEIGPGESVVATYLRSLGLEYDTMDRSEDSRPTIVADFKAFDAGKFRNKYDIVCAFQCLEHMPYELFTSSIAKMVMMTKEYVIISLPYSCFGIAFSVNIALGQIKRIKKRVSLHIPLRKRNRKYRKEYMEEYPWAVHYWEIGRKGFPLKRILKDMRFNGVEIVNKFHSDNPYHYFIVAKKLIPFSKK